MRYLAELFGTTNCLLKLLNTIWCKIKWSSYIWTPPPPKKKKKEDCIVKYTTQNMVDPFKMQETFLLPFPSPFLLSMSLPLPTRPHPLSSSVSLSTYLLLYKPCLPLKYGGILDERPPWWETTLLWWSAFLLLNLSLHIFTWRPPPLPSKDLTLLRPVLLDFLDWHLKKDSTVAHIITDSTLTRAVWDKRRSPELVSWCFEPSQPQRIIPGLETKTNPSLTYSAQKVTKPQNSSKSTKLVSTQI